MNGYDSAGAKRKRSRSPSRFQDRPYRSRDGTPRRDEQSRQPWSHKDQMRINQIQEDVRMREWVAGEDDFVLKQAKKKAEIRVKEGRAKPIDWLAVTLRIIDETRNPLDDEISDEDLDFVDPDTVFDDLSESQMSELRKDIDTYEKLESNKKNRDYWRTMQIICKHRQKKLRASGPEGRAVSAVASDIDKLLAPKTYEQLEALEKQIRAKLDSNEPIDTDYWQQLLDSLLLWKAKAKLKKVYQDVIVSRTKTLRTESKLEAMRAQQDLANALGTAPADSLTYNKSLDPEPALQIAAKDKQLEVQSESAFLSQISAERAKIRRMGYVPLPKGTSNTSKPTTTANTSGPAPSTTQYDRDVARGVDEDEEVFASEEPTSMASTQPLPSWAAQYRPRKPRYFNRVQLGYDWNKYNQTHYSHDAPPPKVVQGYKFHIFYPDLIDSYKAPTYKIIREDGRKKGQTLAPAGEEDTCIIRFVSPGPPYEDVAFRIVDRDWDYSGKEGRGFKSTFEGGVLSLHFSFKKVYYRK